MLDTPLHRVVRAAVDEQVELWRELRAVTTPTTVDPAGHDRTGDTPCR